jgi:cold shock CspA family protein
VSEEIEGVVEAFDAYRGVGVLRARGGERLFFHCVEIADASRTIDPGTAVRARRVAGQRGEDEARMVTPRSADVVV